MRPGGHAVAALAKLARLLALLPQLQAFDASNDRLGEHAALLVTTCEPKVHMRHLNLSGNALPSSALLAFACWPLSPPHSATAFNLSGNTFGYADADAVSAMRLRMPALCVLHLANGLL